MAGATGRLVLEDFPPLWRPSRRAKQVDLARLLSPNGRGHHMVIARAKEHIYRLVWYAAINAYGPRWQPPVHLRLTYVRPVQRMRDQDNWTSGVTKAVLDGLVKAGVLAGDDMARLTLERVEIVVEKGRRALVVEALGGGEEA